MAKIVRFCLGTRLLSLVFGAMVSQGLLERWLGRRTNFRVRLDTVTFANYLFV